MERDKDTRRGPKKADEPPPKERKSNRSSGLDVFAYASDLRISYLAAKTLRQLNVVQNLRVTVRGGVATVRGEVRNLLTAGRVIRTARGIPGVKHVTNMLTVTHVKPSAKRRLIQHAVFHRADFVFFVESKTDVALTSLRIRLIATLRLIAESREAMQREMQRLIGTMTPAAAVPLPPQVLQAQRNASARHLLVTEFGGLTSADIGQLAGSKSSNRAALAHRWKSDGRIFAVTHQGTPTFPGFQFSPEGQPLPVIASLLAILGATHSGWELALWFLGSNGWLGGRRPVDLLLTEPERVIAAAKHEAEALVF